VVSETYEEIVFSEPHEDFYNRVSRHVPGELTAGPYVMFSIAV
jgi:hypothetical protein